MERPRSIVMFERLYLAAIAIGLLTTAFLWSSLRQKVAAQEAMLGSWFLPATIVIGFAISLALWYFIARRGSVVAKWIATVLVALGIAGVLFTMLMGRYSWDASGVIGLIRVALQIGAIWFLFRPDNRAWFGEKPEGSA